MFSKHTNKKADIKFGQTKLQRRYKKGGGYTAYKFNRLRGRQLGDNFLRQTEYNDEHDVRH